MRKQPDKVSKTAVCVEPLKTRDYATVTVHRQGTPSRTYMLKLVLHTVVITHPTDPYALGHGHCDRFD